MKQKYIVFVKTNMFDHLQCLKDLGFIDWWISPMPNVGDVVYIYNETLETIIAECEVIRTKMRNADKRMDNYYDQIKYENYIHPNGYNPLKCMRLQLVRLIETDINFKTLSVMHGLKYPKKSNRMLNITNVKDLNI